MTEMSDEEWREHERRYVAASIKGARDRLAALEHGGDELERQYLETYLRDSLAMASEKGFLELLREE